VAEVLRRAGVPWTAAELEQPSQWTSYDTRIRLFAAATEVLGDPQTMFRVGREALGLGLTPALVLLIRAMGSPRQVYRQLPRAVAKFSTTSTMEVLESGATHATLSYRLHEGYRHSRLDCEYAQGLIGMVPTIFGCRRPSWCTPSASPTATRCVYHLTWERRRLGGRRRSEDDVPSCSPCASSCASCSRPRPTWSPARTSIPSCSGSSRRPPRRCSPRAGCWPWPTPRGARRWCTGAGLPQHQVDCLAATLLAGADPGPNVVAVDVASARGCTAGWPPSTARRRRPRARARDARRLRRLRRAALTC
jgi:hypothetical protein